MKCNEKQAQSHTIIKVYHTKKTYDVDDELECTSLSLKAVWNGVFVFTKATFYDCIRKLDENIREESKIEMEKGREQAKRESCKAFQCCMYCVNSVCVLYYYYYYYSFLRSPKKV